MKTLKKFLAVSFLSLTILSAAPITTHAQSDGGGPWDQYVYSRISKAQRAKVDKMRRQMGNCIVKSIYNAVAFKGISLDAAIQSAYNIGSCHGFNKHYNL